MGDGGRVAVGALIHESNAFAGSVTELGAFVRISGARLRGLEGSGTELGGAVRELGGRGAEVVPTSLAWAQSSGPVADDAAEALVAELVDGVRAAAATGPLDAVVVCLHGSMCSVSEPDLEGAVLTRLRAVVGPSVPIVATLDWHASVTARMVEAADALVGYRTYPHVDQQARGEEAARLALALGSVGDVHAGWVHPPLLLAGPTTRHDGPAMAEVLSLAAQLGEDDRVLTWSVLPGFARSDNASTGAHAYVLATDPEVAAVGAARLAGALWDRRAALLPATEALGAGLLDDLGSGGPLVLSDQGDNPGGGAAGDGTALLGLLEAHGPPGSVVAGLYDPAAVDACHAAGIGATLALDLGGHTDDLHGPTVPVRAEVEALGDGSYVMHSPTHPNVPVRVGPCARIRTEAGTVVVLTSSRVQNLDLELLDHLDIDPASAPVIAVKSNAHFRAAFEPIASRVVDVDTPGLSTPHLERLPYRAVPRPIFPLDRDLDWSPT